MASRGSCRARAPVSGQISPSEPYPKAPPRHLCGVVYYKLTQKGTALEPFGKHEALKPRNSPKPSRRAFENQGFGPLKPETRNPKP